MSFPHYKQLDAMDCGPTSLRIVAQHYGRHYSLQSLRDRCHITREGVSLLGISDAAETIGLRTTGVKITWEQLRDEAVLPCIVHWNQQHFVVVYRIARRRGRWWVWVSDPAQGLLKYDEEQFRRGRVQSRLYGYLKIPDDVRLVQNLKAVAEWAAGRRRGPFCVYGGYMGERRSLYNRRRFYDSAHYESDASARHFAWR